MIRAKLFGTCVAMMMAGFIGYACAVQFWAMPSAPAFALRAEPVFPVSSASPLQSVSQEGAGGR